MLPDYFAIFMSELIIHIADRNVSLNADTFKKLGDEDAELFFGKLSMKLGALFLHNEIWYLF